MRPGEKLAALYRQRDACAYGVVGSVLTAVKYNAITEDLKQALAAYEAAHMAVVDYENSEEYKEFLAGHRG